uniref:Ribosomal protein S18 n=1 Tax=Karenia brevis TaxID=156230 RepID=A0A0S2QDA9_KARBR|nr:ribosomal protein S18 [Karenia brevis]
MRLGNALRAAVLPARHRAGAFIGRGWPACARHAANTPGKVPSGSGQSEEAVRLMLDTKVSQRGTADALFQECIDAIRERRLKLEQDPVLQEGDTPAITKLKQDELDLTKKIFQRVDPSRDITSDLTHAGHNIDPYWSPFHKVREVKDQVAAEFDEYARLVTVAEQKRVRIQIKKSLRRAAAVYNPYSKEFRQWHGRKSGQAPPKPFRLPDKHWEPSPLQVRLARERITWRDVDILQHFIADNGYILPRRTTMLPRQKQQALVQAVKTAQNMSLLPYQWKLKDFQAMPLMDPLQWMADRLTDRVMESRDRRSRAMLRVMMERHPELNYRNFLRHEAQRAKGAGDPSDAV